MNVSILKRAVLEGIGSASGVEVVEGMIYIVSDDSQYLYKLNYALEIKEKISLYDSGFSDPDKISKKEKADLECMAQLSINGYKHLLLMGSGSLSPQRDKGFLVKLPTNYNRKHQVWAIDFSAFFGLLKRNDDITTSAEINLEGLAFGKENVLLLNRFNPSGSKNVVLAFKKEEFIEFIQGHMDGLPFPSVEPIELPSIESVPFGFSGADCFDGVFLFTASAEDTSNAIDDGNVLGSMVGVLEITPVDSGRSGIRNIPSLKSCVVVKDEKGNTYTGKIESLSGYEKDSDSSYTFIAVTDSDGGKSEILMLQIDLA